MLLAPVRLARKLLQNRRNEKSQFTQLTRVATHFRANIIIIIIVVELKSIKLKVLLSFILDMFFF